MQFRAKCWVKHGGGWARAGECFDAESPAGLDGLAVAVEPTQTEAPTAEKPKKARSKKNMGG